MHFAQLRSIDAEHAQRILVAEVVLVEEWQVPHVLQHLDVLRFDSSSVHLALVESVSLVGTADRFLELRELMRGQFVAGTWSPLFRSSTCSP